MATPSDSDQLLALALMRRRRLQPVRTHQQIRAAAQQARAQAAEVREDLRGVRARWQALRAETARLHERLGTGS